MRRIKELPGCIEEILCFVYWKDRNLVVYRSEANEVVILDDSTLLQIIPCHDLKSHGDRISSSIHPDTGKLAVCNTSKVVIYEVRELYGRLPKWEVESEIVDIGDLNSVAWINETQICISTNSGELIMYDVEEQSVTWKKKVGLNHVASYPLANTLLAFTPGESSEVLSFRQTSNHNLPSLFNTGALPVQHAWFVTSNLFAARTKENVFIWDLSSKSLIASMHYTDDNVFYVAQKDEESIFVRMGSTLSVLTLKDGIAQLNTEENSIRDVLSYGKDVITDKVASNLLVSNHRVYYSYDQQLHILSRNENEDLKPLETIKGVPQSNELNLISGDSSIIVGKTLVDLNYDTVSTLMGGLEEVSIVHSEFIDNKHFAVIESNSRLEYRLKLSTAEGLLWEADLPSNPRAFGSSGDDPCIIYVLYANGTSGAFHSNDGSPADVDSMKIPSVEKASVKGAHALVHYASRIEIWNLKNISRGVITASDYGDARIDGIYLSVKGTAFVAYSRKRESWIDSFNFKSPSSVITIPLGSSPVICMNGSRDGGITAVLSTRGLSIFAEVPQPRGQLIEIARYGAYEDDGVLLNFVTRSSICWSFECHQLLLYNGKQLLILDATLDSVSREVAKTHAIGLRDSSTGVPTSLVSLYECLNSALPIYHPSVILLCLEALNPEAVSRILTRLSGEIKYADLNEDGMVSILDPSLNFKNADELTGENSDKIEPYDASQAEELERLLNKYRLSGLTNEDQNDLKLLTKAFYQSDQLDAYGKCALALVLTSGETYMSKFWVYAWFSETKLPLKNILQQLPIDRIKNEIPVWLDLDDFRVEFEQLTKKKFAETRDPTSVTLNYIAMRKVPALLMLWRIASGNQEREKTLKLLSNDFSTTRWRTAAHKNAFALLSKHRPEYAAAFFLLGDSIRDCCQVCVDKLNNMTLALAVARIYDNMNGEGLQFLRARYFAANSEDENSENVNTIWLQFWINWLLNDHSEGLQQLISHFNADISVVFMYAAHGGEITEDIRNSWKQEFRTSGVPDLVSTSLLNPLQTVAVARTSTQNEEPTDDTTKEIDRDEEYETRAMPTNLKPPPAEIQLEPDMSAFGF